MYLQFISRVAHVPVTGSTFSPRRKQYGELNVVLPTQDRGTLDKGNGRTAGGLCRLHPSTQTEDPNSCRIKKLLLIFWRRVVRATKDVHIKQSFEVLLALVAGYNMPSA